MSPILNLLWFLFGGLLMAIGWLLAAVIIAITVIGLPWARACLNLASLALWPFGREAVSRDLLYGKEDIGTSGLGVIGNVIWFVLAGAWLALGHVFAAIFSALTIIGIPFAVPHLKLASIALAPIGKAIVSKEVAEEARKRHASARVDQPQAAGS
ncbi:MAG: YccF domain-containing protein [Parvibaculum sp.]|uniref:YccF domain-containing protein n=1 Tax=Parvibaculum sp. TaxID=2024848 RepID=UPI002727890E|nr:YccF domain-containing protein [Parvibaculum sp.]MDO8839330.1 YccF domain-containing protein [Parvibaculum sp.]MDP2149269.1 YccF domain-containing protein [Parvibaculum sp.]